MSGGDAPISTSVPISVSGPASDSTASAPSMSKAADGSTAVSRAIPTSGTRVIGSKDGGGLGRRLGDFASTLWELLGVGESSSGRGRMPASVPDRASVSAPPRAEVEIPSLSRPPRAAHGSAAATTRRRPAAGGMQGRYDDLVRSMKRDHGVRVVRWRSSTSGCAWQVHYADGTTARLIESPYPRGPMSCAVFLHEIGHHAIGFGTYRPRCLEEYHAWRWSFEAMIVGGFNVTEGVRRRRDEALHYAIRKAARRGLKRLPLELAPFVPVPDRSRPPLPALLAVASADDAA